jgi:hypothetical protein
VEVWLDAAPLRLWSRSLVLTILSMKNSLRNILCLKLGCELEVLLYNASLVPVPFAIFVAVSAPVLAPSISVSAPVLASPFSFTPATSLLLCMLDLPPSPKLVDRILLSAMTTPRGLCSDALRGRTLFPLAVRAAVEFRAGLGPGVWFACQAFWCSVTFLTSSLPS